MAIQNAASISEQPDFLTKPIYYEKPTHSARTLVADRGQLFGQCSNHHYHYQGNDGYAGPGHLSGNDSRARANDDHGVDHHHDQPCDHRSADSRRAADARRH